MGHVTDGVLRRFLDESGSVSDADRGHLATCPRCAAALREVTGERDAVRTMFDRDAGLPAPDVEAAWAALTARLERDDDVLVPVLPTGRTSRWRSKRHQVTAGVTAGLLVLGGTAAAAAADWLPVFRTEAVAPVTLSMTDVSSLSSLAGIGDLADYGELTVPRSVEPTPVADAAEAEARTGLDVPVVTGLPTGVSGKPEYVVEEHQTATFTFSSAKAAQAAQAAGVTLPPVPAGLEGSTLKIEGGPAVAGVWAQPTGIPSLVVARMVAPTASGQGASLEEFRDYLLSVPGIPADLAAQLRTVSGDGKTLPIPVLKGEMNSSTTTVGSVPATVLTSKGGFGSGVVWVSGGMLTVVAGSLDDDEVLAVARGLR